MDVKLVNLVKDLIDSQVTVVFDSNRSMHTSIGEIDGSRASAQTSGNVTCDVGSQDSVDRYYNSSRVRRGSSLFTTNQSSTERGFGDVYRNASDRLASRRRSVTHHRGIAFGAPGASELQRFESTLRQYPATSSPPLPAAPVPRTVYRSLSADLVQKLLTSIEARPKQSNSRMVSVKTNKKQGQQFAKPKSLRFKAEPKCVPTPQTNRIRGKEVSEIKFNVVTCKKPKKLKVNHKRGKSHMSAYMANYSPLVRYKYLENLWHKSRPCYDYVTFCSKYKKLDVNKKLCGCKVTTNCRKQPLRRYKTLGKSSSLEDKILKWVSEIPFISNDYYNREPYMRKQAARLAKRIGNLLNDDYFIPNVRDEAKRWFDSLPIKYPENHKDVIRAKAVQELIKLLTTPDNLTLFEKEISDWIKKLPLSFKNDTDIEQLFRRAVHEFKPLILEQKLDKDNIRTILEYEIEKILGSSNLELDENEQKLMPRIVSDLVARLRKMTPKDVMRNQKSVVEKQRLLHWLNEKPGFLSGKFSDSSENLMLVEELVDILNKLRQNSENYSNKIREFLQYWLQHAVMRKKFYLDPITLDSYINELLSILDQDEREQLSLQDLQHLINQWIPDFLLFSSNPQDQEVLKKKIKELAEDLKKIHSDDNFEDSAWTVIGNWISTSPIKISGTKIEQEKRKFVLISNLLKKVSDGMDISYLIEREVSKWVAGLPLERPTVGQKSIIIQNITKKLCSIMINKPNDKQEYKKLLEDTISEMLELIPLTEISSEKKPSFKYDLMRRLKKIEKDIAVTKCFSSKEQQIIFDWITTIPGFENNTVTKTKEIKDLTDDLINILNNLDSERDFSSTTEIVDHLKYWLKHVALRKNKHLDQKTTNDLIEDLKKKLYPTYKHSAFQRKDEKKSNISIKNKVVQDILQGVGEILHELERNHKDKSEMYLANTLADMIKGKRGNYDLLQKINRILEDYNIPKKKVEESQTKLLNLLQGRSKLTDRPHFPAKQIREEVLNELSEIFRDTQTDTEPHRNIRLSIANLLCEYLLDNIKYDDVYEEILQKLQIIINSEDKAKAVRNEIMNRFNDEKNPSRISIKRLKNDINDDSMCALKEEDAQVVDRNLLEAVIDTLLLYFNSNASDEETKKKISNKLRRYAVPESDTKNEVMKLLELLKQRASKLNHVAKNIKKDQIKGEGMEVQSQEKNDHLSSTENCTSTLETKTILKRAGVDVTKEDELIEAITKIITDDIIVKLEDRDAKNILFEMLRRRGISKTISDQIVQDLMDYLMEKRDIKNLFKNAVSIILEDSEIVVKDPASFEKHIINTLTDNVLGHENDQTTKSKLIKSFARTNVLKSPASIASDKLMSLCKVVGETTHLRAPTKKQIKSELAKDVDNVFHRTGEQNNKDESKSNPIFDILADYVLGRQNEENVKKQLEKELSKRNISDSTAQQIITQLLGVSKLKADNVRLYRPLQIRINDELKKEVNDILQHYNGLGKNNSTQNEIVDVLGSAIMGHDNLALTRNKIEQCLKSYVPYVYSKNLKEKLIDLVYSIPVKMLIEEDLKRVVDYLILNSGIKADDEVNQAVFEALAAYVLDDAEENEVKQKIEECLEKSNFSKDKIKAVVKDLLELAQVKASDFTNLPIKNKLNQELQTDVFDILKLSGIKNLKDKPILFNIIADNVMEKDKNTVTENKINQFLNSNNVPESLAAINSKKIIQHVNNKKTHFNLKPKFKSEVKFGVTKLLHESGIHGNHRDKLNKGLIDAVIDNVIGNDVESFTRTKLHQHFNRAQLLDQNAKAATENILKYCKNKAKEYQSKMLKYDYHDNLKTGSIDKMQSNFDVTKLKNDSISKAYLEAKRQINDQLKSDATSDRSNIWHIPISHGNLNQNKLIKNNDGSKTESEDNVKMPSSFDVSKLKHDSKSRLKIPTTLSIQNNSITIQEASKIDQSESVSDNRELLNATTNAPNLKKGTDSNTAFSIMEESRDFKTTSKKQSNNEQPMHFQNTGENQNVIVDNTFESHDKRRESKAPNFIEVERPENKGFEDSKQKSNIIGNGKENVNQFGPNVAPDNSVSQQYAKNIFYYGKKNFREQSEPEDVVNMKITYESSKSGNDSKSKFIPTFSHSKNSKGIEEKYNIDQVKPEHITKALLENQEDSPAHPEIAYFKNKSKPHFKSSNEEETPPHKTFETSESKYKYNTTQKQQNDEQFMSADLQQIKNESLLRNYENKNGFTVIKKESDGTVSYFIEPEIPKNKTSEYFKHKDKILEVIKQVDSNFKPETISDHQAAGNEITISETNTLWQRKEKEIRPRNQTKDHNKISFGNILGFEDNHQDCDPMESFVRNHKNAKITIKSNYPVCDYPNTQQISDKYWRKTDGKQNVFIDKNQLHQDSKINSRSNSDKNSTKEEQPALYESLKSSKNKEESNQKNTRKVYMPNSRKQSLNTDTKMLLYDYENETKPTGVVKDMTTYENESARNFPSYNKAENFSNKPMKYPENSFKNFEARQQADDQVGPSFTAGNYLWEQNGNYQHPKFDSNTIKEELISKISELRTERLDCKLFNSYEPDHIELEVKSQTYKPNNHSPDYNNTNQNNNANKSIGQEVGEKFDVTLDKNRYLQNTENELICYKKKNRSNEAEAIVDMEEQPLGQHQPVCNTFKEEDQEINKRSYTPTHGGQFLISDTENIQSDNGKKSPPEMNEERSEERKNSLEERTEMQHPLCNEVEHLPEYKHQYNYREEGNQTEDYFKSTVDSGVSNVPPISEDTCTQTVERQTIDVGTNELWPDNESYKRPNVDDEIFNKELNNLITNEPLNDEPMNSSECRHGDENVTIIASGEFEPPFVSDNHHSQPVTNKFYKQDGTQNIAVDTNGLPQNKEENTEQNFLEFSQNKVESLGTNGQQLNLSAGMEKTNTHQIVNKYSAPSREEHILKSEKNIFGTEHEKELKPATSDRGSGGHVPIYSTAERPLNSFLEQSEHEFKNAEKTQQATVSEAFTQTGEERIVISGANRLQQKHSENFQNLKIQSKSTTTEFEENRSNYKTPKFSEIEVNKNEEVKRQSCVQVGPPTVADSPYLKDTSTQTKEERITVADFETESQSFKTIEPFEHDFNELKVNLRRSCQCGPDHISDYPKTPETSNTYFKPIVEKNNVAINTDRLLDESYRKSLTDTKSANNDQQPAYKPLDSSDIKSNYKKYNKIKDQSTLTNISESPQNYQIRNESLTPSGGIQSDASDSQILFQNNKTEAQSEKEDKTDEKGPIKKLLLLNKAQDTTKDFLEFPTQNYNNFKVQRPMDEKTKTTNISNNNNTPRITTDASTQAGEDQIMLLGKEKLFPENKNYLQPKLDIDILKKELESLEEEDTEEERLSYEQMESHDRNYNNFEIIRPTFEKLDLEPASDYPYEQKLSNKYFQPTEEIQSTILPSIPHDYQFNLKQSISSIQKDLNLSDLRSVNDQMPPQQMFQSPKVPVSTENQATTTENLFQRFIPEDSRIFKVPLQRISVSTSPLFLPPPYAIKSDIDKKVIDEINLSPRSTSRTELDDLINEETATVKDSSDEILNTFNLHEEKWFDILPIEKTNLGAEIKNGLVKHINNIKTNKQNHKKYENDQEGTEMIDNVNDALNVQDTMVNNTKSDDMFQENLRPTLQANLANQMEENVHEVIKSDVKNWVASLLIEKEPQRVIAEKIVDKLGECNFNPNNFQDSQQYALEVDKMLDYILLNDLQTSKLIETYPIFKRKLIDSLLELKENMNNTKSRDGFVDQLNDKMLKSSNTNNIVSPHLAKFEVIDNYSPEASFYEHFNNEDKSQKDKIKDLLKERISNFCENFLGDNPNTLSDPEKNITDLYSNLTKILLPQIDSLQSELQIVKIRNIIKEALKFSNLNQQQRQNFIENLSKSIYEIFVHNQVDDQEYEDLFQIKNNVPSVSQDLSDDNFGSETSKEHFIKPIRSKNIISETQQQEATENTRMPRPNIVQQIPQDVLNVAENLFEVIHDKPKYLRIMTVDDNILLERNRNCPDHTQQNNFRNNSPVYSTRRSIEIQTNVDNAARPMPPRVLVREYLWDAPSVGTQCPGCTNTVYQDNIANVRQQYCRLTPDSCHSYASQQKCPRTQTPSRKCMKICNTPGCSGVNPQWQERKPVCYRRPASRTCKNKQMAKPCYDATCPGRSHSRPRTSENWAQDESVPSSNPQDIEINTYLEPCTSTTCPDRSKNYHHMCDTTVAFTRRAKSPWTDRSRSSFYDDFGDFRSNLNSASKSSCSQYSQVALITEREFEEEKLKCRCRERTLHRYPKTRCRLNGSENSLRMWSSPHRSTSYNGRSPYPRHMY